MDQRKILFDTGNDRNAFFSNTEKMGISLKDITDVLFSHKHRDHVAGCREILESLQEHCRVYLPRGFPFRLMPRHLRVQEVVDVQEIGTHIFSIVLRGGIFLYEQSLVLQTENGLVVITGCAHPGIVKILDVARERFHAPVALVLGGFHLFRKSRRQIENVVASLRTLQVQKVAPCHCTGEQTLRLFQEAWQQDFVKVGTGSVLHLP